MGSCKGTVPIWYVTEFGGENKNQKRNQERKRQGNKKESMYLHQVVFEEHGVTCSNHLILYRDEAKECTDLK